ncbi:unnamed protein product, partial [Ectocarpus sp. 8 AP-2014]
HDISIDGNSGEFDRSVRGLAVGLNMVGEWGAYRVLPTLNLGVTHHENDSYVESTGVIVPGFSDTIVNGIAALRIERAFANASDGSLVTPYVEAGVDYAFTGNRLYEVDPGVSLTENALAVTTGIGLTVERPGGASLSLGLDFTGLTTDVSVFSANARLAIPF